MAEEKAKYKLTLNLPQTDFPIKANLAKVEEEFLSSWDQTDIYHQILVKNKGRENYLLHDGPPYPNGDIHLGHALNKTLKDIIIKYKAMSGLYAPYVPGWDCHGLPIETQLLKEIGDKRKEMPVIEFREKCKEYALKYVDLQRREFKKLGIFGEWDKPYLTIDHDYEAKIIELFGNLAEKGYVYRGLKPIHWCPTDQTALAEAEIEYEDDRSPSIYVKFAIRDPHSALDSKIKNPALPLDKPWHLIIWTTTPWTLPANVAVAAHPEYEYVLLDVGSEVFVVAEGLLNNFVDKFELKEHKILDKVKGKMLEGILCRHPFIDRDVPVVNDEYVTLEQGTGFVHIAPGHGAEDYKVGLNYKLPIIMPVDEKGYFDNTVPDFIKGKHYDESNKLITEKMKENGSLLKLEFFKHPYPHCWRCKKPVIFRATEQWFISVEHKNMRQEALKAITQTKWFPAWGENRIRGMVETRPDWCVSRQRAWGVPIPAFYCKKCAKPSLTGLFNKAIVELVKKEGTNGWFAKEAKDILPAGTKCPFCGGTEFRKETDILDVWFESGSSFAAVINGQADLYLEGSDQHRGWFQSSLLLGVGYQDRAPFKAVLTHGFTIDDKGKKMSKSLGNVIDPNDVVKRYGADVLRLWVASTDFRNDMAASEKILKQVQEAYSKIRNTCRFLLSNLGDYQGQGSRVKGQEELLEIDRWILLKLNRLTEKIIKAYDEFEFHQVYHGLYDFCVNDLSAFYLDMSKDRLYCDGKDSVERRSAQFAMHEILTTMVKLMAPILSFTAEDISRYAKTDGSVFLQKMPQADQAYLDDKLGAKWDALLDIRAKAYQKIEELRATKAIGSATAAQVTIAAKGQELEMLRSVEKLLPLIFIVAKVVLTEGESAIQVVAAPGQKCERCWIVKEDIGRNQAHPTLCGRCGSVVKARAARS
ncbi:MAG: isoleucine--tRNA ligase [Candidatus Margulisbacteria bacterium]|jgi:isoleucyl-tRNA synthetase|nr:isoleucine--tRNA ligase [Candidatus Margulisiibacteriota bacterium]